MAMDIENEIMNKIGVGQHYSWFNGSGSCRYIREKAIKLLPVKLKEKSLILSTEWKNILKKANYADNLGSENYGLTNVWITCSYAIQDAIYRHHGEKGIKATDKFFYFFESRIAKIYFEKYSNKSLSDRLIKC